MTNTVEFGLMGNQHIYKYWLHRISHEWDVSCKLLSMGYLTIGRSAYSQSGIESKATCNKDTDVFESMMKSLGGSKETDPDGTCGTSATFVKMIML